MDDGFLPQGPATAGFTLGLGRVHTAGGQATGHQTAAPPRALVLIGGGEHAAVVADVARVGATPFQIMGFSDPDPQPDGARRVGAPCLGGDGDVAKVDAALVLAFGGLSATSSRMLTVARFADARKEWATLIHRSAVVSPTAVIAEGVVVMPGAVVNAGAVVGPHCVVNTGAIIEHDVQLGENVQVSPGAVIGGGARIGRDCYIGLGSKVRDHAIVGEGAVIGMGAVVVGDVPAGATVVGNPASPRAAE